MDYVACNISRESLVDWKVYQEMIDEMVSSIKRGGKAFNEVQYRSDISPNLSKCSQSKVLYDDTGEERCPVHFLIQRRESSC